MVSSLIYTHFECQKIFVDFVMFYVSLMSLITLINVVCFMH